MFTLEGKTVLVTGASRGIGASIARLAAKAGARVLGHASAPSEAVDTLFADGIVGAGDLFVENLGAPQAGFRLAAAAIKRAGRLDAVVNNAGVATASPIGGRVGDWDEGWAEIMAVNLKAPADISRAFIAHCRQHADDGRGGRVVNVASRAGHRGDGLDFSAYAASKGGMLALTK
ncbi:MAG: SDR family oxidoreductase, partial [Parvularculaceae bacterium]|nr:SDR family oxidoreductase [Parvularculaceae bacterium]